MFDNFMIQFVLFVIHPKNVHVLIYFTMLSLLLFAIPQYVPMFQDYK
jgi:hypothetical protein